jgi:hypothetical protein
MQKSNIYKSYPYPHSTYTRDATCPGFDNVNSAIPFADLWVGLGNGAISGTTTAALSIALILNHELTLLDLYHDRA